jgi:branched-chain amino acid transport system permease protein
MIDFVQTTVDGAMVGCSYGLLAIGFTLIFGVIRRLNLSYGPSIMVGAYLGTFLYVQLGAGPLLVAVAVVAGAAVAGIYVERLCFAPMQGRAAVASMVSSFAIWMQLEQAMILFLPRHTYSFPALAGGMPWSFGPFSLRPDQLLMLTLAVATGVVVQAILYRTKFGRGLRLVTSNQTAAHLVGVNVRNILIGAFALASAVGGFAGFLVLAIDQQVTPMFGMWATIKGLIAMMIGGLGSVPGAIIGGLVLGIIEAHAQVQLGPQGRDLTAFLLLFVCLVLRPGGLLGKAPEPEGAISGRSG